MTTGPRNGPDGGLTSAATPAATGSSAGPAALDAAVAGLQLALSELRDRGDRLAVVLDDAAPALLEGAQAHGRLPGAAAAPSADDARPTTPWAEVSALAASVLRAADALAAGPDANR